MAGVNVQRMMMAPALVSTAGVLKTSPDGLLIQCSTLSDIHHSRAGCYIEFAERLPLAQVGVQRTRPIALHTYQSLFLSFFAR
jgi:hypothetical protein